jgi:hypothetical protein
MDCKNNCGSCLMPFSKDIANRENDKYCSLCFNNGKLSYQGNDLKEFQKICYNKMLENGTNKYVAKFYTYVIKFAPRWKK